MWKAEIALFDGLPLNEWLWLAGLGIVIVLLIYVVNEFLDILWRKI